MGSYSLLGLGLKTALMYFFLILAVRLMGKRQVGELQPTELVAAMFLSELAVLPIQDKGSIWVGIVPLSVLVIIELAASFLSLRSKIFERIFTGKPIIIIYDGVIQQDVLKKQRITVGDLFEELRQKDIFDIEEVNLAILENNGKISVLKKEPYKTPTLSDLNVKYEKKPVKFLIISGGSIQKYSLNKCGFDEEWVYKVLNDNRVELKDVFAMTADNSGSYNIIKKQK